MRQFLRHGSLYVHTHGGYGPFYFSFAGLIFRVTGQDPTLFTGRLIVMVFTAVSAAMFAATVWRVTRNLAFSMLTQVITYCVLARVAGSEPMHPGSMVVLVLSMLTYALACYSMTQATTALFFVGATTGALMMIKINVGLFAVDAGLGFAGLSVLGLVFLGGFGAWLPAVALLPALAYFAAVSARVRLALRFLVPLAILQLLQEPARAGRPTRRCTQRTQQWLDSSYGWAGTPCRSAISRRSAEPRFVKIWYG